RSPRAVNACPETRRSQSAIISSHAGAQSAEMSQVRIVRSADLDRRTAQTPGMKRSAAIDRNSVGSEKLWVGVVTVDPATSTGAHHHGDCDSVVCITSGPITIRWGEQLEKPAEAGAGANSPKTRAKPAAATLSTFPRSSSTRKSTRATVYLSHRSSCAAAITSS